MRKYNKPGMIGSMPNAAAAREWAKTPRPAAVAVYQPSAHAKAGGAPSSSAVAKSVPGKVTAALAANAPSKLNPDNRTFHVEDYREASAMIKSLRQGKSGAVNQQWCDALAHSIAAVFKADSAQYGVPFSPAYFVAGTK